MRIHLTALVCVCVSTIFCCQEPFSPCLDQLLDADLIVPKQMELSGDGKISEDIENDIIQQKPIVIPLGQACAATSVLIKNDLRFLAYPFDWTLVYHQSLYSVIKDDFAHTLDDKFICFKQYYMIYNLFYCGIDICANVPDGFGWLWTHHCPTTATKENFFSDYWPSLKNALHRRIRRFYKAINSGRHVYFLRIRVYPWHDDLDKARTAELVALLQNKFPALQFTIIVANGTDEFKQDWGIPHVRNFWCPIAIPPTWNIDPVYFKNIFQAVGLLPK